MNRSRLLAKVGILLTMVLIVAVSLLAVGCDKSEYPVMVRNDISDSIVFRVLGHLGEKVRIAKSEKTLAQDNLMFAPGEETSVTLSRVGPVPQYTFVVETTQGTELFRRTFTRAELEERDWHIVITEAGIE